MTFELNRDDRLWNNGHADVPCRRTGDMQVAYEVQGNDMTVVLRRWTTTATDDATGCATEGHFDNFSDLTPNEDAQGAVNATRSRVTCRGPTKGRCLRNGSARPR